MPGSRILIADDDPLLRGLVEHKLSAAGHEIFTAGDGAAAMVEISAQKPHLIVLDAMMPVLDGFEVLRRLKADPETAALPVIMLTALKREQDVVGALQLGAADYLVKPFIPDELVARIRRFLPTGPHHENSDRGGGSPVRGHG
jgi:DNA-binding response OmpR family regulator